MCKETIHTFSSHCSCVYKIIRCCAEALVTLPGGWPRCMSGVDIKEVVICEGGCWDLENDGIVGVCGRRYVFMRDGRGVDRA